VANIVPSVDGQISVATIDLMWNKQVAQNCMTVFTYNGEETPEISKIVVDTRARFQDINANIAKILAALPAS
jgi:hypothetical protein